MVLCIDVEGKLGTQGVSNQTPQLNFTVYRTPEQGFLFQWVS